MKGTSPSTSPLFSKLRIKFIALNMTLAALVLVVAFVSICVVDFRSSVTEVYQSLDTALENAFNSPRHGRGFGHPNDTFGDHSSNGSYLDGESEDDGSSVDENYRAPEIGGPHGSTNDSTPVAVYAVYGTMAIQLVGESNASVSEDILPEALNQVAEATDAQGYLGDIDLYYAQAERFDITFVAFADGSLTDRWQSLAWGLGVVGVGALVLLFMLNLLFARWALRPVQTAWRQQQQFIADASHELKTPLTVILANNAVLQKRGNETVASQAQWIESTAVEAQRMQGLVTDMLELARSDAGEARPQAASQMEPLDFSRLVEGEVLTFEAVAFERNISWESAITENLSVRGDAKRLSRVVGVLLDNACKYTPAGGGIWVALAAEEKFAVLRVQNSDALIDEEDLAHVFDRFYRADKARTRSNEDAALSAETSGREVGGYGLGLSIAHDIAQAHKGTLTATSSVEMGTIFTLRLPLA